MTRVGEGAFTFCDMSLIFFVVGAILSRDFVLVVINPVREGAIVEILMVLRVLHALFALCCILLTA